MKKNKIGSNTNRRKQFPMFKCYSGYNTYERDNYKEFHNPMLEIYCISISNMIKQKHNKYEN
jgi:hypothetical protein